MELALGSPEQVGEIKIGCPAWKMMIMCVEITGGGVLTTSSRQTEPIQIPGKHRLEGLIVPHLHLTGINI